MKNNYNIYEEIANLLTDGLCRSYTVGHISINCSLKFLEDPWAPKLKIAAFPGVSWGVRWGIRVSWWQRFTSQACSGFDRSSWLNLQGDISCLHVAPLILFKTHQIWNAKQTLWLAVLPPPSNLSSAVTKPTWYPSAAGPGAPDTETRDLISGSFNAQVGVQAKDWSECHADK